MQARFCVKVYGMKARAYLLPLMGISFLLCACSSVAPVTSSPEFTSSETSHSSEVLSQEDSSASEASSVASSSAESSKQQSHASDSLPVIEPDSRWNVNFEERGEAFMVTLGKLIRSSGGTASKDAAIRIGAKAAAYPNENSSTFIPFYHAPDGAEVARQSDCNREHTWPDSRGGSLFENDPVMLRPTLTSDNSARGNFFYGLGGADNREWDPASLGYEASRGECARVILYCATAYHSYGISLSNNAGDATSLYTMGVLSTLLRWNRDYQPTAWEKTVNDRYDAMGYRRNPFVDHPEYAEYIYDDFGLRPTDDTEWYDKVTSASNLDGKQVAIVSEDPRKNGYYMMGDKAKSPSIPWYITCSSVRYENDKVASDTGMTFFTFAKGSDGKFDIKNSKGEYLYGYSSTNQSGGLNYAVTFADDEADLKSIVTSATSYSTALSNISNRWRIGISPSGYATFTTGSIYLECFNGSFCGYQSEPRLKPMLFA